MTDPGLELQRQLQALTDRFAERLSLELPELARLAGFVHDREPEALDHLGEIRDRLHKLAGSAATFGFAQVGDEARRLEQRADTWLVPGQSAAGSLDQLGRDIARFAAQMPGTTSAPTPEPVLADSQSEAGGASIYLLEGDLDAATGMTQTLGNFGYAVSHFATAQALAGALARQLPDALILSLGEDDDLPQVAAIQQRLEAPLPLLVIDDRDDFDSQLAAVRAGAQGYFTRPLDITRLEQRLERCLNQQQGEPFRVLIIDDDLELATRYALVLRSARMQVEVLGEPARLFEALHGFNPEVVLLDVNMPGCSGPELAQAIRLNDEWLRVTIIYLSAETDITRQMAALVKAGDDFITKPISDNALISSVFSHAQRARSLSNALARDSLTGLLKHADIKEHLAVEVQRARRSGKPTSVVMLDIDHFKKVNDSHGHAAGDNVIRALANLMRQRLRRVDSLGRYGGEEFVAVLPNCSATQAKQVIDEIRERFAELIFNADGQRFNVTLSAGVAETAEGVRPNDLLEQADRALYSAKHNGRNQVRLAG
ncbi:diguanylate cyclase [Stutzerimonas nosocomialis]|uniref:diguanylate cyclase n=1 Tax=Stutzerimonas nosocomialis TaxID=1056496 RepID=UPI001107E704|nr:diguanylate cyclase [Stutzerimonas nosocomialis]TLX59015.1 diguanylate cyclase [Stutzerimonas nosocomialis]